MMTLLVRTNQIDLDFLLGDLGLCKLGLIILEFLLTFLSSGFFVALHSYYNILLDVKKRISNDFATFKSMLSHLN